MNKFFVAALVCFVPTYALADYVCPADSDLCSYLVNTGETRPSVREEVGTPPISLPGFMRLRGRSWQTPPFIRNLRTEFIRSVKSKVTRVVRPGELAGLISECTPRTSYAPMQKPGQGWDASDKLLTCSVGSRRK